MIEYRKSSFCQDGSCVEVAHMPDGRVAVRDGKNRKQPGTVFGPAAWASFLTAVRDDGWSER